MSKIQKTKIKSQTKQIEDLKEAIYLKCLDCCCWQVSEPMKCPADDCTLYPFRPKTKIGRGNLYKKMVSLQRKVGNFEER